MKKFLTTLLIAIISSLFFSCHEDDIIRWEDQEFTVSFEILSTSDIPMNAYINHYKRLDTIQSGKKYKFKTKHWGETIRVSCDDYNNELTIKAYVNGKLKKEIKGREYLVLKLKLK